VITSKPSIYELLVAALRARGESIRAGPAAVISSGSELTNRVRDGIEEKLGRVAVNAYGMTEFGLIASECVAGRLHLHTSEIYVEAKESGRDPLGRSELVISSASNDVMPFFRYTTGDLASIGQERCSCGVETPQILQLNGRLAECFRFGATLVPPTAFNELFEEFDLAEFQMEQVGKAEIRFRFERGSHGRWTDDDRARLRVAIQRSLPIDVQLALEETVFGYSAKFQRYIGLPVD
jgi:phenylacetate-CoA ligase